MENYEITKIKLLGIIGNIKSYTNESSIEIPYTKLKEGIENNNISFEPFEYCCKTIADWYVKNISAIRNNQFVNNCDVHDENIKIINSIVKDIEINKSEYSNLLSSTRIKQVHPALSDDKVFIVHGHDDGLKNEVARFLENLGLKPIILHEQPSSGQTIIEKIEHYSNVGFGIVLYTPCDIGGVASEPGKLNARARQNVIFEHGYLMGKLGRTNVVALVKSDIEKPNDISGVLYIPYTFGGGWKTDIAKELKVVGYSIDFNKLI